MLNEVPELQVMAVDMSYRLGWIDESIVTRVDKILKQAKLPTLPPETMTVEMFKSVMAVRELYPYDPLSLEIRLIFWALTRVWKCRSTRR